MVVYGLKNKFLLNFKKEGVMIYVVCFIAGFLVGVLFMCIIFVSKED